MIYRNTDWQFWNNFKDWHIKVYVSYVNLDGLEASSGASIHGTDVKFDKLTVKQSSGAMIDLSGNADALHVDGSSGSMFKGYDLKTTTCQANVSSGADVKVNVTKEISAKASSGGSIRYEGEATIRDMHVSSGVSIRKQN